MKKGGKSAFVKIKHISKNIWDEFVYGGHYIALGDVAAIYVFAVLLGIKITFSFLVVVYLCVFAANLLNRSDESEDDALTNPVRVSVMEKYVKYFYPIVISCLTVSVGLILQFSGLSTLLFAIFIFVLASLYTFFLKDLTKYIIGFKNYIAALFYSLMVFLLAIYYKHPLDVAVTLLFAFYYLRIFISSAACDIKDIEGDKQKSLKTLAIYFGRKRSIFIFNLVNVLSGLIVVVGVYSNRLPVFSLWILLTLPYTSYYIYKISKIKNKEFFSNVIIDGEFLLWAIYILIGKTIF